MKTFYSILYITLNASLDEKVSIGVIMSNNFEYFFKYSHQKLTALKNILDSEKYHIIKTYLKSLDNEFGFSSNNENLLLTSAELNNNWINESYLTYLSKYSNNIIQFSAPKAISIELNSSNFKRIFEKYIFKYSEIEDQSTSISILNTVRESLFPKIKERVNLEMTLTSNDFEDLFAPIKIDFIGRNGIPVAGQTIDFTKKHYNLENDVARYVSFTKAIDLNSNNKGKYYVLGKEPQKDSDRNHQLWNDIRNSNFLEFVDIDEFNIVEEYIETQNVKPYFAKEQA